MIRKALLAAALLLLLSRPAFAGVVGTTFNHLGNDVRYTFGNWPAFVVLGGAIAAANLTQVDQQVADHYRNGGNLGKFDTFAGYAGDFYVIDSAAVITFVAGKLAHADRVALTGETLVEALVITEATTAGLKLAFQRQRPNGSNYGFPSAHAARCFAVATVIEALHGPAFGIPSYLLASAIAFSRIDCNAHNVSDVVFGAAWGTAIGWGTSWFHQKLRQNVTLMPTYNGGPGLAFAGQF